MEVKAPEEDYVMGAEDGKHQYQIGNPVGLQFLRPCCHVRRQHFRSVHIVTPNLATSSLCNVVGGDACVALVTKCYTKINLFMTGSIYLQMAFSNIFSQQKALMTMEIS